MSLAEFARHPLLFGPSPVHRLERLTEHLGGAALWAKRDDCNSGLAYGGNKTRMLEYRLPKGDRPALREIRGGQRERRGLEVLHAAG